MPSFNDGGGVEELAPVPRSLTMAYRRASQRPPVSEQVTGLQHDLACYLNLVGKGDSHARGAALTASFAALRLAVTPIRTEDDRRWRDEALLQAIPSLAHAGLGHVESLVRAALACKTDPGCLVPSARGLQ